MLLNNNICKCSVLDCLLFLQSIPEELGELLFIHFDIMKHSLCLQNE